MSFEMEKYMKQVQPDSDAKADRILELNASHPVFEKLKALKDSDQDKAAKYAQILYHQAELMAGLPIEDPAEYSELVFGLL
jgi:molecular chaperone HtpG